MTAIWQNNETGWSLLAPTGFPAEAALHTLVEQAPQILPLAGAPQLTIVGREVALGNGYADLLAIEPSGRVAIIEVKLANNAEARRAVVAQILAYAAYLKGVEPVTLEQTILGSHLKSRHYESLAHAASMTDQQGTFDAESFTSDLAESLAQGRFRLILVLDQAPDELIRLVGYLESVTDKLVIDLIIVAAYQIGNTQIVVPQRVEAEKQDAKPSAPAQAPKATGVLVEGAEDFAASILAAPHAQQASLQHLYDWAIHLEQQRLAKLYTYHGTSGLLTLKPLLISDNVGLVTIWNDHGAYLSLWRTVFDKRAPNSIAQIEHLIAPTVIGQGNTIHENDITQELLDALTSAYEEAAKGKVQL